MRLLNLPRTREQVIENLEILKHRHEYESEDGMLCDYEKAIIDQAILYLKEGTPS